MSKHYVHAKPYADIEEKKGTKHTHIIRSSNEEITKLSKNEQIHYLQAQNRLLQKSLKSIADTATEQLRQSYELVWFYRNMGRLPNKNEINILQSIENGTPQLKIAISQLTGPEREYYHGFNSGLLAAARMFLEHSQISEIIKDLPVKDKMEISSVWEDVVLGMTTKHEEQIQASRRAFPNTDTIGRPTGFNERL